MASIVKVQDENVTIRSDEACLAEWQQAATAVARNGGEYVIFGSRKVVAEDIDEILRMISFYEDRVLAARGATGRNIADFSGGGANVC